MAPRKRQDVPDDLRRLAQLARDWCVRNTEIDLPLPRLIEWSTAVSPGTTNRALHIARICRAVDANLIVAMHPRDHAPLPYVVPAMLPDVLLRLPGILAHLDVGAVAEKKRLREEAESRRIGLLKEATLGAPLADSKEA